MLSFTHGDFSDESDLNIVYQMNKIILNKTYFLDGDLQSMSAFCIVIT